VPPDGLFGAMKEVLDDQGILFVSDEVQTGWGRTGDHFWGYQAHGIVPDMLTFAKGLGNGLPIGGVVARAELMDSVTANSISTFGGNPLVTSGALAVLDFLADHDLQANARVVGARLADGLRRLAEGRPAVGDVRAKGLMLAVELVEPGTTTPAPALAASLQEEARRGGLLVGKGGLYGNVLRIAPPLILTEAEADEGLEILAHAFTTLG
jgi:4-aminobutyrate aminotransferase